MLSRKMSKSLVLLQGRTTGAYFVSEVGRQGKGIVRVGDTVPW